MRCRDCRQALQPTATADVIACPSCGYSVTLFQPVDVGGPTTLTKAGAKRVLDGSGYPRKANGEFGVEVPS